MTVDSSRFFTALKRGKLSREVLFYFLLSCGVFALSSFWGCGESATEPAVDTYTISGTLVLNDGQDPSPAVIRLFAAPQNSQIQEMLSSYALVGFADYETMLFDPLTVQPLKTVSPGPDGSFQIDGLDGGAYVVSASLSGYGCSEPEWVSLSSDADIGDLELSPEQEISGNITADQTWHSGDVYAINSDVLILAGVTLTIEEGTLIQLKGDYEIKVFGSLQVEGLPSRPVRFRLHPDYYTADADWNGIRIEIGAGDCQFSGMSIQGASTALEIKDGVTTVSECLFDAPGADGVFFSTLSSGEAKYCIALNGDVGLRANLSSPEFSYNLILNMSGAGIDVQDSSQADVHNNVIVNCGSGIRSSWFTAPTIQYNLISGGSRALDAERGFDAVIQYNVFTGQTGETVHFSIGYCYPDPFSYNNFLNAPLHILYVDGAAGQQADTVFAVYNYWDGEDPDDIPVRIIDGYDHGTQGNPIGIVVYNPILDTPVTLAGP